MKYLVLVLSLLPIIGFSQIDKTKREDIQAKRVEFITRKLDLTVEEAEKFWPISNEYDKKRKALRKEKRQLKPDASLNEMSEDEAEKLIEKHIELKQKEVDLEKEYIEKFKSVLSAQKVIQLQVAEEQFKRELLRRLKERRQGQDKSHHK